VTTLSALLRIWIGRASSNRVPKTMEMTVRNTDTVLAFTVSRAPMDAVERQRTTVDRTKRIGVFRVFGRDAVKRRCTQPYGNFNPAAASGIRFSIKVLALLQEDKKKNPAIRSGGYSEGAEWRGYR